MGGRGRGEERRERGRKGRWQGRGKDVDGSIWPTQNSGVQPPKK